MTTRNNNVRFITVGLALLAAVAVLAALLAIRTAGQRSDEVDTLTNELETARTERNQLVVTNDELAEEVDQAESGSAVMESRWLSTVAVSGDYSPAQSRLLAVEAATLSPTAESMAALGELLFADARTTPTTTELAHDGPVWLTDVASSADIVATGSDDATAKIWTTSGDLLVTLDHSDRVRALDFSADDQFIATGSADGTSTTWSAGGDLITSIQHADQVNDIVLNRDGGLMVSGGHDGSVRVVDTATGELRREFQHGDIVWGVALSTDEAQVAAVDHEGMVRVWDLSSGDEVANYDLGQPATVVEFSPDGLWLFAGGQLNNAIIIDTADGEASPSLEGAFRGPIVDIDWHPDGSELGVVSLGGIHRYDLSTKALIAEHQLAGGARGIAYGPDGSWFVSGSGDFQFFFGEIAFWDSSSGVKLLSLNLGGPVESIAVHPSGTVLASFRSSEDLVEVGGALLVPGPESWLELACDGTNGVISEQTWNQVTGESASRSTTCP